LNKAKQINNLEEEIKRYKKAWEIIKKYVRSEFESTFNESVQEAPDTSSSIQFEEVEDERAFDVISPFGIPCTWESYKVIDSQGWLNDTVIDIMGKYATEMFAPKIVRLLVDCAVHHADRGQLGTD